jgi:hypothetical protein
MSENRDLKPIGTEAAIHIVLKFSFVFIQMMSRPKRVLFPVFSEEKKERIYIPKYVDEKKVGDFNISSIAF